MEVRKKETDSQKRDVPRLNEVADEITDVELEKELEKWAFDDDKLSWDCDTKFVTFCEDVELPAGRTIEEGEVIEIPSTLAEKLIDSETAITHAWKCISCGEIYEQTQKPPICENPNCRKKTMFKALHPIDPTEIGDVLNKNYNFATIMESVTETKPGLIHIYDDGVYEKDRAKGTIRKKVKEIDHKSSQRDERKVIDHISILNQYPEEEFGIDGKKVVTNSGILELPELNLKPHDPDKLALAKINAEYDSNAECPMFMDLLETVIPQEKDRKRLQELAGSALVDTKLHKKAIVIVGPTDAGKSTLLEVIAGVFGGENVSRKTLTGLADTRWDRIALRFSKINISDEMSTGKIKRTDRAKKIIAGSKIDAEDKGVSSIDIHPTCEHIYATNQTPYAAKGDDAFWNRFLIAEAPHEIPDDDQEKNYSEKILDEEKSGILNWMIEGYKIFTENGKEFSEKEEWHEVRDRWMQWGDSVQRFLELFLEHDEGKKITTSDFYQIYLAWVREDKRLEAQSQKALTSRVKQTVSYSKYSKNFTFDGNKERAFKNIGVKAEKVEQMETDIFNSLQYFTFSQCLREEKTGEKEKTEERMEKSASKCSSSEAVGINRESDIEESFNQIQNENCNKCGAGAEVAKEIEGAMKYFCNNCWDERKKGRSS